MRNIYLLTVELPEDFEKGKEGQCTKCPLSYKIPSSKAEEEWEIHCVFEKNPKDCPLITTGLKK